MSTNRIASRRTFLKGGALLAAPLATASVMAVGTLQQRITDLEDESAIRTLHDEWLRRVNGGEHDPRLDAAVRRITADHAGAADRFEWALDHRSAVGYFDHAVEFATPLPRDSTLAQMAHLQGHGVVRRTERRLLEVRYRKSGTGWTIDTISL